ncbi:MAG: hypothetical protein KF861_23200 [Planctomycetaceae bacterium]|nr:hypothetical protein [Planctomycetaceae bacterium]
MRRFSYILTVLVVFGLGYWVGAGGRGLDAQAQAQPAAKAAPLDVSPQVAGKIKEARYALQEAVKALQNDGRYETITADLNTFLILSGGGNAREDLESGRGVDPETFAALHAGLAIPEVADHLGYDDKGRLTYQNKVVRMYSVSRLQQSYQHRLMFADPAL